MPTLDESAAITGGCAAPRIALPSSRRGIPAVTLKTCFRCDWQGETREPGCPNCGTQPLYVVGGSSPKFEGGPARNHPDERNLKAPSAATMPPSGNEPPLSIPSPSSADASGPTGRSLRSTVTFLVATLVLIVTVGAWLNKDGEHAAPAASTSATPRSTPTGDGLSTLPPHLRLRRPRPLVHPRMQAPAGSHSP